MIVRALRLEGFTAFEDFAVEDLPEGRVVVVGPMGSGKTAWAEGIEFALFGETSRTVGADPAAVIRWGAERCRVELVWEAPDGGEWGVERRVDREGAWEARLWGPGVALEGVEAVGRAVRERLRLDPVAYRDGVWVDGREVEAGGVQGVLGIGAVSRARAELARAAEQARSEAEGVDRDLAITRAVRDEVRSLRTDVAEWRQALSEAERAHGGARAGAVEAEARLEGVRRSEGAAERREEALVCVGRALHREAWMHRAGEAVARLEGVARAARVWAERVESEAPAPEDLVALRAEAERAAEAERRAAQIEARVSARAAQLGQWLDPADPDGVVARLEACTVELSGLRRRAASALVSALGWTAVAVGLGAGALATRYPEGTPAWSPPRLGVDLSLGWRWELPPSGVTVVLGVAAGVAVMWAGLAWLRRGGAKARWGEAVDERDRLRRRRETLRLEREACEGFVLTTPGASAEAAVPIRERSLELSLGQLWELAGDVQESPSVWAAGVRVRLAELEARATQVSPSRRRVARVQGDVGEAAGALGRLVSEGGGAEVGAAVAVRAETLEDLETAAGEAVREAVRVRVELEARGEGGEDLEEALAALQDALREGFEAAGSDGLQLRETYQACTGLPEVLGAEELPVGGAIEEVVAKERGLGDEVLGARGTWAERREVAEAGLMEAYAKVAQAEAQVKGLRAQGSRWESARERLEGLDEDVAELEGVQGPKARAARVQGEAARLLAELEEGLLARYRPAVVQYIDAVLPTLTGGRYRTAEWGAEHGLRVYCARRGGWVGLEETSGGLAALVGLAVRLGVARAAASARGPEGPRFVVLDAPVPQAEPGWERGVETVLRAFEGAFAQAFVLGGEGSEWEASRVIALEGAGAGSGGQ